MCRLAAAALVPALLLAGPAAAQTAPPPPAAAAPAAASSGSWLPLAAGIGAIVGVVSFNVLALGLPALPGGMAASAPAVAAEFSVAMSRVYATASAIAGGLMANWAYESATGPDRRERASWWPVDPQLLAIGAGAIVGAVGFNLFTAPLGTVPLAGAPLAAVPTETALGSRILAGLSGAAGAIGATAIYDWVTGEATDYAHAAALAAGALGGIAIGNVLQGSLGTLPYYAGAGEVAATASAMASAAAQASSRVYVIASGVFGAWTADYLWRRNHPPAMPSTPR
ncbi:MAG: hypothetical protein AB7P02_21580 [Alphaproteobacteria bacterium]